MLTGVEALVSSTEEYERRVKRVVLGQFKRAETEATTYAKQNAPWTDRTGNARSGLFAKARVLDQGNTFELVVAHTVHYGIWLEIRFSGKYAIIQPTVDYIGTLLIDRIGSSLGRIGAGV